MTRVAATIKPEEHPAITEPREKSQSASIRPREQPTNIWVREQSAFIRPREDPKT
jgi:hypothetical protein